MMTSVQPAVYVTAQQIENVRTWEQPLLVCVHPAVMTVDADARLRCPTGSVSVPVN